MVMDLLLGMNRKRKRKSRAKAGKGRKSAWAVLMG
jgi:hypothetical protein